jgi:hypothetical protein
VPFYQELRGFFLLATINQWNRVITQVLIAADTLDLDGFVLCQEVGEFIRCLGTDISVF